MGDVLISLLIVFFTLFPISYFVLYFVLNRSKAVGLKKRETTLPRWASQSKPVWGGIAFVFVSFIGILLLFGIEKGSLNIFCAENMVLMFTATIAFMMGLADDLMNASPYTKFFIQLLIGIIFISAGIYIHFFNNDILNYLLTIFWVVGIMNSFNMLDNMDGITSTVSITLLSGFLFVGLFTGTYDYIVLPLVVLPILIIFLLFFNRYPSKMYMGDNGSQFMGALLAGLGIIFVWNHEITCDCVSDLSVILAVLLFYLLPLTDTTTVTVNRLMSGVSPFKGDKNHTTHNLVYAGIKEQYVPLLLFVINGISVALGTLLLVENVSVNSWVRILFVVYVVLVFTILYINTKIKHNENKNS